MRIFIGQMFWSWIHFKATYWLLRGPKVRRKYLNHTTNRGLKRKKERNSTMTKRSERVHSPSFLWRLMVQEGNCFMLSWPCQCLRPPSHTTCLRPGEETGLEGSWTCQNHFFSSVTALVCQMHGMGLAAKGCPHSTHFAQKHSPVPLSDSKSLPAEPCCLEASP